LKKTSLKARKDFQKFTLRYQRSHR